MRRARAIRRVWSAEEDNVKNTVTVSLKKERLASVCINYAYLDWLAGVYGDISLDAVIDVTKNMLGEQLSQVKYRKFSE